MGQECRIRKYRRRDREAVMRITAAGFGGFCLDWNIEQHFGELAGSTWQERKCAGVDYDLARNPEHTLVAQIDGEVVGYLCGRVYRTRSLGHVANMAVHPDHQDRGVGKALLSAALDHFRDCGLEYVRIETLEQNYKTRKLYPSFGFEEVGRQVFYFREL